MSLPCECEKLEAAIMQALEFLNGNIPVYAQRVLEKALAEHKEFQDKFLEDMAKHYDEQN